jgi:tRNA threonylcarbamoyladenosine biosynthesis protein TsaE
MKKTIASEVEMHELGIAIGEQLRGGEVIELIGDVGAGKTTLTKGIARGMGVSEDVQSPIFTLSRVYDASQGRQLAHYDFYRLSDPGILADELADVLGDSRTVTIIEWAAIVEGVLPDSRSTIRITSPSETSRTVLLEGVAV